MWRRIRGYTSVNGVDIWLHNIVDSSVSDTRTIDQNTVHW